MSEILPASTARTAFIGYFERGSVGVATPVTSFAEFANVFGEFDQISQFFRNGGQSASVVGVSEQTESALIAALEVLDPTVNLLSIPAPQTLAVIQAAIAWCEANRCFYLIDPPQDLPTPASIVAWLAVQSANAAIAWPRVLIQSQPTATSGTIAGIYAANDAARGVWDAPAGLHAPLVCDGLEYTMTDAENVLLTQRGINAIRKFPTHGIVLWGARTLSPETLYVPVKRTEIFIEDSLTDGLQWAVFEPNNETLWAKVRLSAEAFLTGLWREGALTGSKPEDAFFVRCDATTMTQSQIDAGQLICVVGVALARPAEFVIFRIAANAAVP